MDTGTERSGSDKRESESESGRRLEWNWDRGRSESLSLPVSSQAFLRPLRFLSQLCHFFWARSEGAVFRDQRGDQVARCHVESIIHRGAALRRQSDVANL